MNRSRPYQCMSFCFSFLIRRKGNIKESACNIRSVVAEELEGLYFALRDIEQQADGDKEKTWSA
jgi:hypothetical protein